MSAREQRDASWAEVAARLERIDAPEPLSELQLARIARRVFATTPRTRRRWLVPLAGTLLLAFAATSWLLRVPHAPRPIGVASVSQPTPAQPSPLPPPVASAPAPARMALVGSGVSLPVADGRSVVSAGDVALRTTATSVELEVPDGRVVVAAGSLLEVRVHRYHTRVAVYRGQATLRTAGFSLSVDAGHEGGAHGVGAASPARAHELDAALDGDAAPAAEQTLARAQPTAETGTEHDREDATAVPEAAPVAKDSPAPATSVVAAPTLGIETELLTLALDRLRRHDAAAVLTLTDAHALRFPSGALASEVALVRAEALAQLHRSDEALAALAIAVAHGAGPADRVALLQGEISAAAGRCPEALTAFTTAARSSDGDTQARALLGRGGCAARVGDRAGARVDLEHYLRLRPHGAGADVARRALGE